MTKYYILLCLIINILSLIIYDFFPSINKSFNSITVVFFTLIRRTQKCRFQHLSALQKLFRPNYLVSNETNDSLKEQGLVKKLDEKVSPKHVF